MLQKLLTESAEWKFEALWKVLGVPKRLLSCLKTKQAFENIDLCAIPNPKKSRDFIFSGPGFKSNPGIPQEPAGHAYFDLGKGSEKSI